MPFIITARPDDLDRGPGAAVSGLGQNIARIGELVERKRAQKAAAAERERELGIEEDRARAALLKERVAAAEKGAEKRERDADRAAVMQGLKEQGIERARAEFQTGFAEGLQKAGGVLGPFGILRPVMGGVKATLEVQRRTQQNMEMASRMSPPAAKDFLERETAALKQETLARGYQEEFQALNDMVIEGRIEPKRAKKYVKAFQQSLRDGKPPGAIHERLAKESELHVRLQTRMEDWDQADIKAKELIDSLRKIATDVGDGVDPETGKSMREIILKRLSSARVEWNRTKPGPSGVSVFRQKNDPDESLAALEKLLFDTRVEIEPEEFLREMGPAQARPRKISAGPALSEVQFQARQEAQRIEREKRGFVGRTRKEKPETRKLETPEDRSRLQRLVIDAARETLSAGSDRRAKAVALRDRIAKELGLDVSDPRVFSATKEVLERVYGRTGKAASGGR